jgi:hypothetical protein
VEISNPDHVTAGEILLGIVLALLSIAFGLWAKKVDELNKSVKEIYSSIHSMAVKMEKRVTRVEERVHFHAQKLGVNHYDVGGEDE